VPASTRISIQGFDRPAVGNVTSVLRKLLWTGLYAGLSAAAAVAARRVASQIWRIATGETPPTKK
jgi:hypothetical protein